MNSQEPDTPIDTSSWDDKHKPKPVGAKCMDVVVTSLPLQGYLAKIREDREIKFREKQSKVRNKAPAPVQISAEQLLREAKERELEVRPPPPKQNIQDPEGAFCTIISLLKALLFSRTRLISIGEKEGV